MQRAKTLGLALVATLALSGLAVSSASAIPLFLASKTGLLLDFNEGEHIFTTGPGKEVICKKETSHGFVNTLKTALQLVTVNYSECTAFGFEATVSPAEYSFDANGTASVLNTITITAALGPCTVKVSPTGNAGLNTVKYLKDPQNANAMLIDVNIKGITQTTQGNEFFCGKSGNTAEYIGKSLVILHNGSIEWHA